MNGGPFTLGGANQIGAVSGSVGTIALTDGSSLSVGGSGLTATGDVSLNTSGDLTLDAPLSGAGVSLTAATGNVLVNAGVNANTLAVTADNVLVDAAVNANILDVTANNVSQTSGVITAATLNVNGGNFTLDGANQIGAVSGSVGTIALTDGSSLSVGGSGLAATGDVSLNTSGDLTLDGVVSGADVSLTAGDAFINAAGSHGVVASGRWLIASANPTGDTFDNLDSGNTAVWELHGRCGERDGQPLPVCLPAGAELYPDGCDQDLRRGCHGHPGNELQPSAATSLG